MADSCWRRREVDVLLTADQNIEYQQNLATLPLAVVVMVADSNRLESLEPLVFDLLEALAILTPKSLVRIGALAQRANRRHSLRRIRAHDVVVNQRLEGHRQLRVRPSQRCDVLPIDVNRTVGRFACAR